MSDETVHHEEKTTCAVRHAIHDVLQVWGQSQNHSLEVGILKTKAARQRTENNCEIPILQSLSAPLIKIVHITILVGMPWILYEFVVITSQDSKLTSTRRHFFLTKRAELSKNPAIGLNVAGWSALLVLHVELLDLFAQGVHLWQFVLGFHAS